MRLEQAILDECRKLISRYHQGHAGDRAVTKRFVRATGSASEARVREPGHWSLESWFNPFKVRSRAPQTAKALLDKIAKGTYQPYPALVVDIAKPGGGGTRPISIFPVADAALASTCFKSILERNASRLSPFSYAYREDIGVHDAIERLWRETATRSHHFLVEFDFSKYFDTIQHDTLIYTVERHFKLTHAERKIVGSLLTAERAFGVNAYRNKDFRKCRRGIPQGNTLSLFLANAACHELDLALMRAGALFARYADDIIVVCKSRPEAEEAREHILSHCAASGLAVNIAKSPGITEVGPHGLRAGSCIRTYFDFLGHQFCYRLVSRRGSPARHVVRRLSMRPSTEARVRARIGRIVFSHLLRYPQKGLYKDSRVNDHAKIDWDVVTCINDLRSYVYGGMPENEIQGAVKNRANRAYIPRGIMAFFPHLNDIEQLRRLDGWLLNALQGAIELRRELLRAQFGVKRYPDLSRDRLLAADWYNAKLVKIENDVRVPSFMRAWKYSRKALGSVGLRRFPSRRFRAGDEDLYE